MYRTSFFIPQKNSRHVGFTNKSSDSKKQPGRPTIAPFHLVKTPGKTDNISSSDRFPLKTNKGNTKKYSFQQMEAPFPRIPSTDWGNSPAPEEALQSLRVRQLGRHPHAQDWRGNWLTESASLFSWAVRPFSFFFWGCAGAPKSGGRSPKQWSVSCCWFPLNL